MISSMSHCVYGNGAMIHFANERANGAGLSRRRSQFSAFTTRSRLQKVVVKEQEASSSQNQTPRKKDAHFIIGRRAGSGLLATLLMTGAGYGNALENLNTIDVISETQGNGAATVRKNSLVLIHYKGTLSSGEVFDTTRGGLKYRDGGEGTFRPIIVRVNGDPVPGVVEGLQQGLIGMSAGGKKTFTFPSSLGFGSSTVMAPYGIVPANAQLTYEVEVLRVSNSGPDELMKYINKCGQGGAGAQESGCKDIVPM